MSEEREEMLSAEERRAMLSEVFKKPVVEKKLGAVSPGSSSSPSPDRGGVQPKGSQESSPSQESFGSLLEQTLQKRAVMDAEEAEVKDEVRKQAIDESRQDLIGSMVKVLFR
jgi:hypothetical protein